MFSIYVWPSTTTEEERTPENGYVCTFRDYEQEDILEAIKITREKSVVHAGHRMMYQLEEEIPDEVKQDPGMAVALAYKVYEKFDFGFARFEEELRDTSKSSEGGEPVS